MRTRTIIRLLAILAAMLAFAGTSSGVFAHERRDIGAYRLTVGFAVEPAFEGQKNGVSLRVATVLKQGEKEELKPVEGLEKTLRVEVTHVPSAVSKTFDLKAVFRDPGNYVADLLPTAPGYYRFRFFGTIDGTQVNETFNSKTGGGGFNDIESSAEIQFPQKLPEVREVTAAVRGAQTAAEKAQDAAASTRALAVAGVVLGALGLISSIGMGVYARRRK